MADPLRTANSRAFEAASDSDRKAKIEQLLLVGLKPETDKLPPRILIELKSTTEPATLMQRGKEDGSLP